MEDAVLFWSGGSLLATILLIYFPIYTEAFIRTYIAILNLYAVPLLVMW